MYFGRHYLVNSNIIYSCSNTIIFAIWWLRANIIPYKKYTVFKKDRNSWITQNNYILGEITRDKSCNKNRELGNDLELDLGVYFRGHLKDNLIFLNRNPHFSLYILIASLKSFSKHYNKVIFCLVLFELWGLKVTIFLT